jgi:anti-anti-sigma factor
VVRASGELDATTVLPLRLELAEAAAAAPVVVVDASGVTFGDCGLLNLLLQVHCRTDLRVAAPPPGVSRLFRMVGADTVLKLYPTVREAERGGLDGAGAFRRLGLFAVGRRTR